MSIKMIKMIWDYKLPESIPTKQHSTIKLVLLKLADNSDDNGKSFPSMDRIAHECSIARRTVVRATETLESSKIIYTQRRTNDGLKINSIYWLNIPMLIKGSSPYKVSNQENENPWFTDESMHSTDVTICPSDVTICPNEMTYDHINHQEPSINKDKRSFVQAKPKRSKFKYSDDDFKCAKWIRDRVVMVNPAAPKVNMDSWANTVRLMTEMDKKTHREILEVFKWANLDSFWCNNIQSPDKLRKQFGNLKGRMINEAAKPSISNSIRKLSAAEENEARLRKLYGNNPVEGNEYSSSGVYTTSDDGYVQQSMETQSATVELDANDWRVIGGSN